MRVTVLVMLTFQAGEVTVEDLKGFGSQQREQTWQPDGEEAWHKWIISKIAGRHIVRACVFVCLQGNERRGKKKDEGGKLEDTWQMRAQSCDNNESSKYCSRCGSL